MTRDEIKDLIGRIVAREQGCKLLELVADEELMSATAGQDIDISQLVQELVQEHKLFEIEFVLTNMPYRVKSFLLPRGTQFIRIHPTIDWSTTA